MRTRPQPIPFVVFSAYQQGLPPNRNQAAHELVTGLLAAQGIKYVEVVGAWQDGEHEAWNAEQSILVNAKYELLARDIAEEYNQLYILYVDEDRRASLRTAEEGYSDGLDIGTWKLVPAWEAFAAKAYTRHDDQYYTTVRDRA